MRNYEVRQLGQNKGAPRLWLEGQQPERAGFAPGSRYKVEAKLERNMVVLSLADDGDRVVSRKEKAGKQVPVIDLNSQQVLSLFQGMDAVRVVMKESVIYIMPLASEVRKRRRIESLKKTLEAGEPITVGSLSHGGGVLSHAVHHGLREAGVESRLVFANDIRSELLEHASQHNDAWDSETRLIAAPLQEVAFDRYVMESLPEVHLLEMGLPCSGASVAGRAKRGLGMPEDHPEVGHLVAAAISVIAWVNPAVILFENVVQYGSSASMSILRSQLRDLGYNVHERQLEGKDWNCLENRKRMVMVATTEGIDFDFDLLIAPEPVTRTLAEVLEDVPDDDPRWSKMEGLRAKEERDKAAGKGFAMQIYGKEDDHVGTITKGYAKVRSTDPKIRCESNPELLRQLTPAEHARCKDIPPHLVEGLSNTIAHELLGQSIVYTPFVGVSRLVGEALKRWARMADAILPVVPQQALLLAA